MNNKNISNQRTTGDLQALSQVLMPLTKKIVGKNGFAEIEIITHWSEIIGNQLAQYSMPQKIIFPRNEKNNGCLHLAVPSGAFAIEIQHREKYILEKINTYFGYHAVSTLKIIQNSEFYAAKQQKNNISAPQETEKLLPEEEEEIKNLCKNINNENLKEILINLGHSVYANNHKIEKNKNEV